MHPMHPPHIDGLTGDDDGEVATAAAGNAKNSDSLLTDANRRELCALADIEFRFDEPMSRHTTLRIGGPADVLALPSTTLALESVLAWAAGHRCPVLTLGGGSNLLVRDGGLRGVVIGTRRLTAMTAISDTEVHVAAGALTSKVLSFLTARGLGGAEFLGGVPGTIGGGLIMNAGTYLGEFKDITREVESLALADTNTRVIRRANADCGFGYRTSALPHDEIIVGAMFALVPRDAAEIRAAVAALRVRRHAREPKGLPSAGSIFKNPPGDFAGRLIEAAGCKGWREGDSLCSPAHSNWVVNAGAATAQTHIRLMERIVLAVQALHGITLVPEVKVIGEDIER